MKVATIQTLSRQLRKKQPPATKNVAKAKKSGALSAIDPMLDLSEAIPFLREGLADISEQLNAFQAYLDAASASVCDRGATARSQHV